MNAALAERLRVAQEHKGRANIVLTRIDHHVATKGRDLLPDYLEGKEGDDYLKAAVFIGQARAGVVNFANKVRPIWQERIDDQRERIGMINEIASFAEQGMYGERGKEVLEHALTIFEGPRIGPAVGEQAIREVSSREIVRPDEGELIVADGPQPTGEPLGGELKGWWAGTDRVLSREKADAAEPGDSLVADNEGIVGATEDVEAGVQGEVPSDKVEEPKEIARKRREIAVARVRKSGGNLAKGKTEQTALEMLMDGSTTAAAVARATDTGKASAQVTISNLRGRLKDLGVGISNDRRDPDREPGPARYYLDITELEIPDEVLTQPADEGAVAAAESDQGGGPSVGVATEGSELGAVLPAKGEVEFSDGARGGMIAQPTDEGTAVTGGAAGNGEDDKPEDLLAAFAFLEEEAKRLKEGSDGEPTDDDLRSTETEMSLSSSTPQDLGGKI